MQKIKNFSDKELYDEYHYRIRIKNDKIRAEEEKAKKEAWQKRQLCAVVGRGYIDGDVTEQVLFSGKIMGNGSHIFNIKLDVCDTVQTYFHNVWDWCDERLDRELRDVIERHINEHINNPKEIATLCGLACHAKAGSFEYNDWLLNATRTLCKFGEKKLRKAINDCAGKSIHGELDLLKKALLHVGDCDNCLDRFDCFTEGKIKVECT